MTRPLAVDRLYAMQTPQIFERALLEEAYRAAYAEKASVTDEVFAVEELGRRIVLVVDDDFNVKTLIREICRLLNLFLSNRESDAES